MSSSSLAKLAPKTYSRKRSRTVRHETPNPLSSSSLQLQSSRLIEKPVHEADIMLRPVSPMPHKRQKIQLDHKVPSNVLDKPALFSRVNVSHPLTDSTKVARPSIESKCQVFTGEISNLNTVLSPEGNQSILKVMKRAPFQQNQSKNGLSKGGKLISTQSQTLKENILSNPPVLGPPVQLPSPKVSRARQMTSAKHYYLSGFARRPSVGVHKAHIRSPPSFLRRLSGSHALQQKSQNQDWLTPASLCRPSLVKAQTKRVPDISFSASDDDFRKNHTLFRPQGSSTPLPSRIIPQLTDPVTPSTPVPPVKSQLPSQSRNLPDTHVREDMRSDNEEYPPRRVVHVSHDSIFSSFDVSKSPSDSSVHNAGPLEARPVIREAGETSSKTDDENMKVDEPKNVPRLHDMLSGLGLSDEKPATFRDSGIGISSASLVAPQDSTRCNAAECKTNHRKVGQYFQSDELQGTPVQVTFSTNQRAKTAKRSTRCGTRHPKKERVHGRENIEASEKTLTTKLFLTIDDDPLIGHEDEDDELLLTSKGWDWDPRKNFA